MINYLITLGKSQFDFMKELLTYVFKVNIECIFPIIKTKERFTVVTCLQKNITVNFIRNRLESQKSFTLNFKCDNTVVSLLSFNMHFCTHAHTHTSNYIG